MLRLPRALAFLLASGVVLCSCAAAKADESGYARPSDTSVSAGPQDVRVDTPDTYVESTPERVVVCAGEVRVVIGPGGCPVSPPALVPEPTPEPGRVAPEAPAPEGPTSPAPATAEPAVPKPPEPERPGPGTPPAPEPAEPAGPATPVEATRVVETAHREALVASERTTADTASGVFTPMRTMVIIAVVGAVAAAGAGSAGAARRG